MHHAHDHLEEDSNEEHEPHPRAEADHRLAATTTEDDDPIQIRAHGHDPDRVTGGDSAADGPMLAEDLHHIHRMIEETDGRISSGAGQLMTVAA